MKISSTAVALLASNLALLLPTALAQQCILGGFELEFDGSCTPESIIAAYEDQVFNAAGATTSSCTTNSAESDLLAKVQAAGLSSIADLCTQVYATQDRVPFSDAANRGDDMHFEQMFYNGLTDWQDEVETIYEREDQNPTSILEEDAEAVRMFFDTAAQGSRVEWPGASAAGLPNFQSSVTDTNDLATCTTNAAMCCWPKDRQANDNNGNCNKPYDINCVDKDPADNTNLCFVDLERGNASTGIESTEGMTVFPHDNNDGEGAIHCHGLAWSNDANDHTARYKANNLFFVSMYDHMYQRGYVKNIPGAPMCGCVEQMPTVSRSDCTQVDMTESIEITFDGANFNSKVASIDVNFNACQGINNRNNDLWAYMARLYYQGDITPAQFGEAGRIITNVGCDEATKFEINKNNYMPGYDHDISTWTNAAGREAMYLHDPYGHRAFTKSLVADTTTDPLNPHYGIIYRACRTCYRTHMKIFYRRRTPVPDEFDLIDHILYREDTGGDRNVWNVDFSLHSTYEDAVADINPWLCPNDSFVYSTTFYGKCSPSGVKVEGQRSRFHVSSDKNDVAFFANKPEDDGLQIIESTPIKGRDWAGGIALQDPSDGTIYMTGSGRDIWWYHDDFNYMSQPAQGDHTVIVHAGSISARSPSEWSKSGIMFRTNMESNSANYGVYLTGSNGVCPQARLSAGAHPHGWTCVNKGATEAWLKVEKRIDTYTSFLGSQDVVGGPITWTVIDSRDIPGIGESYNVGLAVSSARSLVQEVVFTDYEVDVYYFPSAAPTTSNMPTVKTENLLLHGSGGVATQSSTCHGGAAARAIDGNTNGYWGNKSVQHTCGEANQWWKVTLDPSLEFTIYRVIVYNRLDCCMGRQNTAELQILDDSGEVVSSQEITGSESVWTFDFDSVIGSSVRIFKARTGVMNFAEVEVLGVSRIPSPTRNLRR